MIERIKNVLSQKEHTEIHKKLTEPNFPWYMEKEATNLDKLLFFTHGFYRDFTINSNFYSLVLPILKILDPVSLVTIRANLNYNRGYKLYSGFHEDRYQNKKNLEYKTAIYYVNTNNGYTELKDKTKIKSIANSMVIFPANTTHRICTQTDTEYRILINFNYF